MHEPITPEKGVFQMFIYPSAKRLSVIFGIPIACVMMMMSLLLGVPDVPIQVCVLSGQGIAGFGKAVAACQSTRINVAVVIRKTLGDFLAAR